MIWIYCEQNGTIYNHLTCYASDVKERHVSKRKSQLAQAYGREVQHEATGHDQRSLSSSES